MPRFCEPPRGSESAGTAGIRQTPWENDSAAWGEDVARVVHRGENTWRIVAKYCKYFSFPQGKKKICENLENPKTRRILLIRKSCVSERCFSDAHGITAREIGRSRAILPYTRHGVPCGAELPEADLQAQCLLGTHGPRDGFLLNVIVI